VRKGRHSDLHFQNPPKSTPSLSCSSLIVWKEKYKEDEVVTYLPMQQELRTQVRCNKPATIALAVFKKKSELCID
jgi:hypothetical protein